MHRACVLQPPASWSLPFGPLDSVVVVDTESELLTAMERKQPRVDREHSTDDPDFGARSAEQLMEVFGGMGAEGESERLHGNFPGYSSYPGC